MKYLMILYLLLLQFCTNSEKTEKEVFAKRESVIGKWQLFETCISPGSACILEKVENGLIIEFKENGDYLVSNNKNEQGAYSCNGKWQFIEIETNPTIKMIQFSPSCNKALYSYYFGFNEDNTLNINPPCIEECRFIYKPIQK